MRAAIMDLDYEQNEQMHKNRVRENGASSWSRYCYLYPSYYLFHVFVEGIEKNCFKNGNILTFGEEVWEFFDFLFPMLLLLLLAVFVRFFHVGSHNIILLHDAEKTQLWNNLKIRFPDSNIQTILFRFHTRNWFLSICVC